MIIFNTKKIFFNYKFFLVFFLFVLILPNYPFLHKAFSMTAPEFAFNGEVFTPECDPSATYFDVPGVYPPINCGTSISLPTVPSGEVYEIRDLDENLNYIFSAWVISAVGSPGLGGCIYPDAINFNPEATYDDGDCEYEIYGCTSEDAINYDPSANIDDGSCVFGEIITPISAPATVYNGGYFTPVCGTGVVYFDSPNAFAPMNCGDSVTFGNTNATYELRGLDDALNVVEPTIFVQSVYNLGGSGEADTSKKRIIQQYPIIEIFAPLLNSFFSNLLNIDYKVTDPNDLGTIEEKIGHGLSKNPVSIFYTDKNFEWLSLPGILIEPELKTLIVKDLPAIGKYAWSVKDLEPGTLYRIIINAKDNSDWVGEAVSGYFSVDFTAPVFKIKTDPTLVRKGKVKIVAESSEDLKNAPILKVTQRGAKSVNVSMKGSDMFYEGEFEVLDGFDGTAKIEIEGEDLAGNIGKEIISGGTFSVGVNPPPKPIILSDIHKSIVYDEFIEIKGTVREDTEAILFLNGTTTLAIKPDSKGNFVFSKIKLDKFKNKGLNYINILSKDAFDNLSESASIEIKYNAIPKVSITKPTERAIVSNKAEILAKASDENLDILYYTYEIIPAQEYNINKSTNNWSVISKNIPGGNLIFDTTDFDDGEYFIRTIVDDGYIKATSSPVSIILKNTLPYFRFENGRKTITRDSNVVLNGKVLVPTNIDATIKSISYSLDNGVKWIPIKVDIDNPQRELSFSINLNNLREGNNNVLWTVKDTRDFVGRTSHLVIVDKTAPLPPFIKNLRDNINITDESDENNKKDGIQINIRGIAEPNADVTLLFNDGEFKTKVLATGEFNFSDIDIKYKGGNKLRFIATDEAGNSSKEIVLNLIYNNPPEINFINPKPFRGLSGLATLSWEIEDKDGDRISDVEVSYRQGGGTYKILVSNANPKGTYVFDTSNLQESNYYDLKITATDSISKVSSISNFTIDRSLPKITAFDVKSSKIEDKFTFTGEGLASDSVSGIEFIEYSIKSSNDKERSPWYLGLITKGYLQKQASFSIRYPKVLYDDTYRVYARVVDISGNISEEVYRDFVIDRTPPRIGSFSIIKEDLNLIPDQDGNISFYRNTPFIFSVSAENDTDFIEVKIGDKAYELNRNMSSGLWEGEITLSNNTGSIFINARDKSGNFVKEKEIGKIKATESGRVLSVGEKGTAEPVSLFRVRIYKYDDISGSFKKFNPLFGGVPSVVETDDFGKYELILSAGKYKLSFIKAGYKLIKREIELNKTEIIDYVIETKKLKGLEKIVSDIFNVWFY